MLRRSFLSLPLAASLARVRAEAPGLRLGFDTYSLRAWNLKALELLDVAAELKLDTLQISSLGDLESFDPKYLTQVKDKARSLDITLDGGTGCICPTSKSFNAKTGDPAEHLMQALKIAHGLGARSLRCFLGSSEDRFSGVPFEKHMEATIAVFRKAKAVAQDTGVKIALENHSGDMQAWELKTIIEEAGKDYVAACLDTGNPIWVAEDPLVTMEVLGPYTVTTHVRDSILFEHPRGCAGQWVVLGEGCVDFKQVIAAHQRLCPQAGVQLEVITGRPPRIVPYLEPSFWKAYPQAKADEFARFVSLVRKGHPFMSTMVVEDAPGKKLPEFAAALKTQQRVDLDKSIAYAKQKMGLGLKARG